MASVGWATGASVGSGFEGPHAAKASDNKTAIVKSVCERFIRFLLLSRFWMIGAFQANLASNRMRWIASGARSRILDPPVKTTLIREWAIC
jgi:hypothetical protein